MTYVVTALWRAREGEEQKIRELIGIMTPLSRDEPACRFYQAHLSPDDPRLFYLYEQYDDEQGYQSHMATEHFEKYVRGEAIPRLESRERSFYVTID
jgi:quinol monooxygenase YgiN